jgi:hypothetical protein
MAGSRKPVKLFPFALLAPGHRAKAAVLMGSESNLKTTLISLNRDFGPLRNRRLCYLIIHDYFENVWAWRD